jgi:hypothetical protein
LNVVKHLLEIENIDIHLSTASNDTAPLHIAIFNGHINIVKEFLIASRKKNKLNSNIKRSSDGGAPLHFAAQEGHIEIVKILLDAGANPNIINHEGTTPLHCAAQDGHIEIVKLLLAAGANPNIKNIKGSSPLDRAVHGNHLKISLLLDGFEQSIHSCLIQRMKALGFESNAEGICYGFAEVAKLLALSGEKALNHFYSTLFLLKRLTIKDLLLMCDAPDNRNYIDILALFNGIELAFQGQEFNHLLHQKKILRFQKKD